MGGRITFLLTILDLKHFIGFLKRLIKSTINLEKGHNFETNPDFKKSSGSYRKHKNNKISLKCCNIIVHIYSTNLHTSLLPPTLLFSPYNAYMMNRLLPPESIHCLIDRKRPKVCPQKIRSLGIDTIFDAIFYEDSIKNKVYYC